MSMSSEGMYANWLLRLLIEPDDTYYQNLNDLPNIQWDIFLRLVQKNIVLVRSYDRLEKLKTIPDAIFREAVTTEQNRIRHTVELIDKISKICAQAGISFIFTKAFQHYPDMGHDVDLLVLDRSDKVDALITEKLNASPMEGSLLNHISGKEGYNIEKYPSPLEIHHGRMGHIGEHNVYPDILMKNRISISIGGITTFVPRPEDQLVVQIIQRIYDHRYIRLSDIVHTLIIIREDNLDWDYVVKTTNQMGIFYGLCCYISYIEQIYNSLFKKNILSLELKKMLKLTKFKKVQFKRGYYRLPNILTIRAYWKEFSAKMLLRDWEGIGKLCLLFPVAILAGIRNLTRYKDSDRI